MSMHRTSPLLSLLLSVLVLACDPPTPEKASSPEVAKAEPQSAKPPTPRVVEDAGDAAVEQPVEAVLADFSVHEWGLVRHVGGQLLVSTSPPERKPVTPGLIHILNTMDDPWDPSRTDVNTLGDPNTPFGGGSLKLDRPGSTQEKPLILLHPGPTFELDTELSVSVELVGGTFREVWPTPALGAQPNHGATYTWSNVHATTEPCGRELAPSPEHIACTSIAGGGLCEAAEMSLYLSPVASCLSIGDTRTPALVYNGLSPDAPAPLALGGGAPATIKNQTGYSFGPLYVHQGAALLRIEKLEANGVIELSTAVPFDGELEAVLKRDLLAKGLSEGEADSFVAAWSPDVLRQPWVWQVFGFYSPEGVEAIAPMTVSPRPKEIVRVMAVTIE